MVDMKALYKNEIEQKIHARKNIIKEYHPEGKKSKTATKELAQLEDMLDKIGGKAKVKPVEV